jgi:hypothetical protein
MSRVIIGVDPHKRSATIEVINEPEQKASGRTGSAPTATAYRAMIAAGRQPPAARPRVGCGRLQRIGRHLAQRLLPTARLSGTRRRNRPPGRGCFPDPARKPVAVQRLTWVRAVVIVAARGLARILLPSPC